MPTEQTELRTDTSAFTAHLARPEGESERGAVLLPGANHTAFDDAVFDRLAAAAPEAGVQFLRYQTWGDSEELVGKPTDELHAEVDAAFDYLRERGCTRVTLVGKSAGGGIALEYAPAEADALVLWAPAIFVDGGDVLAGAEVPADADPATIAPADLSAIDVPVDILQGDEDRFPVANARELAAEIPDATTHVVEGADHSFVGGEPETETVERTVELLARPAETQ